ncbi:hypothetical protein Taro_016150 [Colocasia esculenta]|uniref:Uncharacterized protein n=1 Tax=Colocasia esculenta TaxID=4460 RepID=A0A843UN14_COLES|nr:hypothetical protein [Colocasia esculenta]
MVRNAMGRAIAFWVSVALGAGRLPLSPLSPLLPFPFFSGDGGVPLQRSSRGAAGGSVRSGGAASWSKEEETVHREGPLVGSFFVKVSLTAFPMLPSPCVHVCMVLGGPGWSIPWSASQLMSWPQCASRHQWRRRPGQARPYRGAVGGRDKGCCRDLVSRYDSERVATRCPIASRLLSRRPSLSQWHHDVLWGATVPVLPRVVSVAGLCVSVCPKASFALRTFRQRFGVVLLCCPACLPGAFEGGIGATSVLELAADRVDSGAEGKTRPDSPLSHCLSLRWFRSHVVVSGVRPQLGQAAVLRVLCVLGGSVLPFAEVEAEARLANPCFWWFSLGVLSAPRFRSWVPARSGTGVYGSRPCSVSGVRGGSAYGPSTLWRSEVAVLASCVWPDLGWWSWRYVVLFRYLVVPCCRLTPPPYFLQLGARRCGSSVSDVLRRRLWRRVVVSSSESERCCSCCYAACVASVVARRVRAIAAWLALDSLAVVFLYGGHLQASPGTVLLVVFGAFEHVPCVLCCATGRVLQHLPVVVVSLVLAGCELWLRRIAWLPSVLVRFPRTIAVVLVRVSLRIAPRSTVPWFWWRFSQDWLVLFFPGSPFVTSGGGSSQECFVFVSGHRCVAPVVRSVPFVWAAFCLLGRSRSRCCALGRVSGCCVGQLALLFVSKFLGCTGGTCVSLWLEWFASFLAPDMLLQMVVWAEVGMACFALFRLADLCAWLLVGVSHVVVSNCVLCRVLLAIERVADQCFRVAAGNYILYQALLATEWVADWLVPTAGSVGGCSRVVFG